MDVEYTVVVNMQAHGSLWTNSSVTLTSHLSLPYSCIHKQTSGRLETSHDLTTNDIDSGPDAIFSSTSRCAVPVYCPSCVSLGYAQSTCQTSEAHVHQCDDILRWDMSTIDDMVRVSAHGG